MVDAYAEPNDFFSTRSTLSLFRVDIDFGFMLGISPGGVGFEAAPFKMPQEYIDILGGVDSPKFEEFRKLMRSGFRDVRKHAERIIMIVELMQKGESQATLSKWK